MALSDIILLTLVGIWAFVIFILGPLAAADAINHKYDIHKKKSARKGVKK